MTPPSVSILIPTWNGAATLPVLLTSLAAQKTDVLVETVVIDSGSTDGTLDLVSGRVDRLLRVEPGRFNHGLTRNAGIAECRGDLVILLVQDAVPATTGWLAALIRPFQGDERLAGAFARQIPRPDASAVTRYYAARYAASGETPRLAAVADRDAFLALASPERLALCTFDNVCSCVRRAVWVKHPFAKTAIAEDLEWARDVLLAGYRLAFVPEAAVIHSHERSARYEFKRTYLVHHRLQTLFGLATVPTWRHLLRAIASTVRVHGRCLAGQPPGQPRPPREVVRALGLAVAFPLGQYLGARAARRGRHPPRWTGV
jgi:GT2 family glycosyltransferase